MVSTVEAEILALRNRCRKLQLWCASLTVFVGGACLTAAIKPREEVVRAQRFELVDATGKRWGVMEAKDGAAGLMFEDTGEEEYSRFASIGIGAFGPHLVTNEGEVWLPGSVGDPHGSCMVGGATKAGGLLWSKMIATGEDATFSATNNLWGTLAGLGVHNAEGEEPSAFLSVMADGEDWNSGCSAGANGDRAFLNTWFENGWHTANELSISGEAAQLDMGIHEIDDDEDWPRLRISADKNNKIIQTFNEAGEELRRWSQ